MGWPLPGKRQWTAITRQWCHIMTMDTNRINKQVFTLTCSRANIRNKNWVYRVSNFYRELRMDHMMDIDTCNQNLVNDMEIVLSEYYEADWLKRLNKVEARRANISRNKLRTCNQFKKNLKPEVYLQSVLDKRHCSAPAKFRWRVAPIQLDTGRYIGEHESERICQLCNLNEIESEEHEIIRFPIYHDYRQQLFNHVFYVSNDFLNVNDCQPLFHSEYSSFR